MVVSQGIFMNMYFYEQEIFLWKSKAEEIYTKVPSYSPKNVKKISHYLLISD
jgi:hypothetical protein